MGTVAVYGVVSLLLMATTWLAAKNVKNGSLPTVSIGQKKTNGETLLGIDGSVSSIAINNGIKNGFYALVDALSRVGLQPVSDIPSGLIVDADFSDIFKGIVTTEILNEYIIGRTSIDIYSFRNFLWDKYSSQVESQKLVYNIDISCLALFYPNLTVNDIKEVYNISSGDFQSYLEELSTHVGNAYSSYEHEDLVNDCCNTVNRMLNLTFDRSLTFDTAVSYVNRMCKYMQDPGDRLYIGDDTANALYVYSFCWVYQYVNYELNGYPDEMTYEAKSVFKRGATIFKSWMNATGYNFNKNRPPKKSFTEMLKDLRDYLNQTPFGRSLVKVGTPVLKIVRAVMKVTLWVLKIIPVGTVKLVSLVNAALEPYLIGPFLAKALNTVIVVGAGYAEVAIGMLPYNIVKNVKTRIQGERYILNAKSNILDAKITIYHKKDIAHLYYVEGDHREEIHLLPGTKRYEITPDRLNNLFVELTTGEYKYVETIDWVNFTLFKNVLEFVADSICYQEDEDFASVADAVSYSL